MCPQLKLSTLRPTRLDSEHIGHLDSKERLGEADVARAGLHHLQSCSDSSRIKEVK